MMGALTIFGEGSFVFNVFLFGVSLDW
jgi:hypothetical protein